MAELFYWDGLLSFRLIPIMIIFVAKFKNHIRKIQESTLVIIFGIIIFGKFSPQKIGLEIRNFEQSQFLTG